MTRIKLAVVVFVVILASSADWATGHPAYLKQVKKMGLDAKNCAFCHESPKGGKKWNERGMWLKEQKKQRGAKKIDPQWLKDYPADQAVLKKS